MCYVWGGVGRGWCRCAMCGVGWGEDGVGVLCVGWGGERMV